MTIDEAGHDGHLPRVERLRLLGRECVDLGAAADSDEAAILDGERLGARRGGVHGVDLGVEDHQVRAGDRYGRDRRGEAAPVEEPGGREHTGDPGGREAHEFPAAMPIDSTHGLPGWAISGSVRPRNCSTGWPLGSIRMSSIRLIMRVYLSAVATGTSRDCIK